MIARIAKRMVAALAVLATVAPSVSAQVDSGPGIRTSMFETFIGKHQLLVFPIVATTRDHNFEYQPAAFGYGLQEDFRGHFSSREAQLFLAYGVTDWLAIELETSEIHAHFVKSPGDTSATPATITESGIADYAGQVRVRLGQIFAAVEVNPPVYRKKVLIGDSQWNVKGEIGATRGYRWGSMTFRTTVEYNRGDRHWDLGETSLEYLRPVSRTWRMLLAIEGGENGGPDEWTLVTAAGWRVRDGLYLKFANALGLFSKSTDWEPQVGVLWAIR